MRGRYHVALASLACAIAVAACTSPDAPVPEDFAPADPFGEPWIGEHTPPELRTLLRSGVRHVPSDSGAARADGGARELDAGRRADAGPGEMPTRDAGARLPDAGDCVCASSPCASSRCVDGACVTSPLPDGTACGELADGACLRGSCRPRGCGDGIRDRGTSTLREGCDDGELSGLDACSAMCEPRIVEVPPVRGMEEAPSGPGASGAVDGTGAVLFVWTSRSAAGLAIHGRRYFADGRVEPAAVGDPIVIVSDVPTSTAPVVAGLRGGGWAVAWSDGADADGHSRDVLYQVVGRDGSVSARRLANVTTRYDQFEQAIAPAGDGFVIVWTDDSGLSLEERDAGTRARVFTAAGEPRGGEIIVQSTRGGSQRLPSVAPAATGEVWIATWTHVPSGSSLQTIRARRFDGSLPVDAADEQISSDDAHGATVTLLETGDWAAAWVSRASDYSGDVHARVIAAGTPLAMAAPTIVSSRLSWAELAPAPAPLAGSDFFVAWQDGGLRSGVAFAAVGGRALAPESTWLGPALDAREEGDVFAFPSGDGIWIGWSGLGADGIEGAGHRGFFAYHLPRD